MFDGSYFAALQDVILVTSNYRVNGKNIFRLYTLFSLDWMSSLTNLVFGFPGPTPNLPQGHMNLGILDVKLSLDWTRRNIEAFGGDPNKITIFGESAGSIIVDHIYLTTPPTNPPFRAAIMQSGTYYLGWWGTGVLNGLSDTYSTAGHGLSKSLGCGWDEDSIPCMKNKTTDEIKKALNDKKRLWGPVPDGGITVAAGNNGHKFRSLFGGARVPIMLGSNADEAMLFLNETNGTWERLFNVRFPELKPYESHLRAAYPVGGCSITGCWKNELEAVAQVITDYMFTCLSAREARASAYSLIPTWRYRYNSTSGGIGESLNVSVPHAYEIPQVFRTFDPKVALPNQVRVSDYMQRAWADFAKDPLKGPGWPSYSNVSYLSYIAAIGGPQNPGGESFLRHNIADAYCGIYDALYDERDPSA